MSPPPLVVSRTSGFLSMLSGNSEHKKNNSINSSAEQPTHGKATPPSNNTPLNTPRKETKPTKVRSSYIAAAQSFLNRQSSSLRYMCAYKGELIIVFIFLHLPCHITTDCFIITPHNPLSSLNIPPTLSHLFIILSRNSRGNAESADAGDNDGGDYFGVSINHSLALKKGGGGELGLTPDDPNYDLANVRYFDLVLCDNVMPNMDGTYGIFTSSSS